MAVSFHGGRQDVDSGLQMNNLSPLKVLLAHEDPMVVSGLRHMLGGCAEIIVGTVPDSTAATMRPEAVGAQSNQLVIADYVTGVRIIEAHLGNPASTSAAPPHVLILTTRCGEYDVEFALRLGVQGYVCMGGRLKDLEDAIRTVSRGTRYLCASVSRRVADSLINERLSDRELEVLRLLVAGDANKSIADELNIALGTVKAHVKAILSKLQAGSRTHAAAVAAERGLLPDLRLA